MIQSTAAMEDSGERPSATNKQTKGTYSDTTCVVMVDEGLASAPMGMRCICLSMVFGTGACVNLG